MAVDRSYWSHEHARRLKNLNQRQPPTLLKPNLNPKLGGFARDADSSVPLETETEEHTHYTRRNMIRGFTSQLNAHSQTMEERIW